jgi:hypothetical protein
MTRKILHALVGYLTVTSLPFAFASPLATVDYDGYVDTSQSRNQVDDALMKHVLDIAETCQTVTSHSGYLDTTTPNHSDSALEKRVPGDVIEARHPGPLVEAIIVIVTSVAIALIWISDDGPVRGSDIEFLV